jgi:hypothetical protein
MLYRVIHTRVQAVVVHDPAADIMSWAAVWWHPPATDSEPVQFVLGFREVLMGKAINKTVVVGQAGFKLWWGCRSIFCQAEIIKRCMVAHVLHNELHQSISHDIRQSNHQSLKYTCL